jgi:hypothetical protein
VADTPDWMTPTEARDRSQRLARIDTTVAHPARRYDYWLGGKDNFPADRESGDQVAAAFPTIRLAVLENRAFLRRAVTYLAREAGIRQFLDVGTGIPTANNTHQVAQAVAPGSRIVYVDNDPIVLVHARALLTSSPEGATAYLDADLRDSDRILSSPEVAKTLDLTRPVGLMLVAVMHFMMDSDEPYGAVSRLVDAMPSGSFLTVSQATNDFLPPEAVDAIEAAGSRTRVPARMRSREEFARFFDGLDLVDPGIVSVAHWRDDDEPRPRPSEADIGGYGAVARIP